MADHSPETPADDARVAQAEAFIARHRANYSDAALHEQLGQAGYSDEEIRLAFGRLAPTVRPRPAGVGMATGLGVGVALANFILFPLIFLLAYMQAGSASTDWLLWVWLGLLLLGELGLLALLNRRSLQSGAWLLALLAPITIHLIYFGLCITGRLL